MATIRNITMISAGALLALSLAACGSEAPATTSAAPSMAASAQASIMPSASAESSAASMMPSASASPSPTATPRASAAPSMMPSASAESSAGASMHDHAMTPGGETVSAEIKLFSFQPNPIEIPAGTTITWTNQDDIEHSVTSGSGTPDGTFDSEFFTKGQTFSQTFDEPGEYTYFCKRHPSMTGTITVSKAEGAATPPAGSHLTRLDIPDIGLDVQPIAVGLDDQQVPIVPRHDVGWFESSALPGQGSNIVLWGHVLRWKDSPDTAAPFERIHELKPGAEIVLETEDRQPRRYRVTQQVQVRPENTSYLAPTPGERVTLISCIGDNVIDNGTLTKEFRLVTIAMPVHQ